MLNLQELGWDPKTLGELDHRKVRAPYVRLSSYTVGQMGDVVYVYDLRMTQPNKIFLKTQLIHSLEHMLLYGFRKYLEKEFINIAPMGCQTGCYLVLLNEGNADKICKILKSILQDILVMNAVPYSNRESCGQCLHHSLEETQHFAKYLLDKQHTWRYVFDDNTKSLENFA